MDAFWTEDERASRETAAQYFRDVVIPSPAGRGTPGGIWSDLDGATDGDGPALPRPGRLAGRVSLIEAAAHHSPKLGRDVLAWRAAAVPLDPLEGSVLRLGRLAGTATHVLEAGVRSARERGAFSSSLMGCREVQESLAALLTGADLVRLGACRLCRLLEKGDRDRASRESARLDGPAAELEAGLRSVAQALLGEAWVDANLALEGPAVNERTRP